LEGLLKRLESVKLKLNEIPSPTPKRNNNHLEEDEQEAAAKGILIDTQTKNTQTRLKSNKTFETHTNILNLILYK
jgi:hypothetical protein